MNKTKFSVMEASKAFKKSRTTIYESIKTGYLSRDNDGFIDLSELIRVYGNPIDVHSSTRTKQVHLHVQSEVESVLKDQISLLKNQLDLANQREKTLMQHIEELTHRIDFKGVLDTSKQQDKNQSLVKSTLENQSTQQTNTENLTSSKLKENKRIPVSQHNEPKQLRRGWLSRLFLRNN